MWGWEFLPSGVQLYAESWTNHVLEEGASLILPLSSHFGALD